MQLCSSKSWFAVQVRPRMENTVKEHLSFRGYECFLPKRCGKQTENIAAPLFPGYVFCRFDAPASAPVLTTPGVSRIVSFGGLPARIDDSELEPIRRAISTGQPVAPLLSFRKGETTYIADGPLRGITGTVMGWGEKKFLILTIMLLQRAVSVELDPRWIKSTEQKF